MKINRRTAIALGLIGAGTVVVARAGHRGRSGSKATSPSPAPQPPPTPGGGWVDADAPRRIRALAGPLADQLGWPDLPDLLVAIAWTESRGNPQAQRYQGANAARGWFQMRPNSARLDQANLTVDALKREADQVALVTWYLHRLRNYARKGQDIDLLALRRGMAYPFLVADVDEDMSTPDAGPGVRSRGARERFAEGLAMAGEDESFMFHRAFPPGYHWPGIDAALQTVRAASAS